MKKVLFLITILCVTMVFFAGCDLFTPSNPETPCEHDWVDATCTAPKTCSLCGETEGEPDALNHKAEADDGDCTTAVKCANEGCEEILVAALSHAPEADDGDCTTAVKCTNDGCNHTIVAALSHTPEADDGDCTTEVKCSNEGCEEVLVAALTHTPEADDGDVTTAVKCANEGCEEILVAAKEAITLTIPTFENGAVIADKMNYAIGDTVKLTVNPDWGYAQKLYIDGEPLMLDWNNNIYTFVAQKDTYLISGAFETALDMSAGSVDRWDYSNQGHGVVTTYYPNNNDAWWFQIKGNYESFSINAKNYREVANSYEGGPDGGWRIALYMKLDNGNYYAFSMWIDTSKIYAYQHFGGKIAGDKDSTTGWSGAWRNLAEWNAEATAALNGNGAEFKLERIDGNHIQVTFGGVVLETYEIPGVTAENKVVAVGLHHWGNKGSYVDIPFAVTEACDHAWDAATCTTPKTCSKCGETVGTELGHSYTNYTSNNDASCTVDGTKTAQCDNCTEKNTIADVGTAGHKNNDDNYECDVCGANLCTNHVPEADDGDCTTAIKCSVCGTITTEAKGSHTPEADDGDLATAVKCSNDGCDHICVPAIVISTFENGTVTTDKTSYNVGDTVTLTVAPAKDYAQKLYLNGEPILVDTSSKYSFVLKEGETYNITGEFVSTQGKWFWIPNTNGIHDFDMINQGHNIARINKSSTGELVPKDNITYGGQVLVKDPNSGTKKDFAIAFKMHFADGQKAEIRLVCENGDGKYKVQVFGNNILGNWATIYNLTDAENAAVANGDGVWFGMVREGTNVKVLINNTVVKTYDVSGNGITADTKISQFKLQAYNWVLNTNIPYEFYMTE